MQSAGCDARDQTEMLQSIVGLIGVNKDQIEAVVPQMVDLVHHILFSALDDGVKIQGLNVLSVVVEECGQAKRQLQQ